ncbi:MAG: hypothetical protein OEV92_01535 [Nitrospinota bacterium]|nr:hypothetical protein [Nitrospinota bacterium]
MARLQLKIDIVRALFARSGNQCAFPNCVHPLVNDQNKFIGQVCHIEAAMPRGPRYNPKQTDEERRSYSNLILLCYRHHVETDDEIEYPTEKLLTMKNSHEEQCRTEEFTVSEDVLRRIVQEIDVFWANIERLNTIEHEMADMSIKININDTYYELTKSCYGLLDSLSNLHDITEKSDHNLMEDFNKLLAMKNVDPNIFSDIPYYENPFSLRNWTIYNLGFPNHIIRLRMKLAQMEIRYIEELIKQDPSNKELVDRMNNLRAEFEKMAQSKTIID